MFWGRKEVRFHSVSNERIVFYLKNQLFRTKSASIYLFNVEQKSSGVNVDSTCTETQKWICSYSASLLGGDPWLNSLRSLLYHPFFCNFIAPWNDCLAPLQTIVDNFTIFHRFHSQAFSQEVSLSKSILTYLLLAEMITTSWSWRLWQYDCVVAPCMFQVGVPDWA